MWRIFTDSLLFRMQRCRTLSLGMFLDTAQCPDLDYSLSGRSTLSLRPGLVCYIVNMAYTSRDSALLDPVVMHFQAGIFPDMGSNVILVVASLARVPCLRTGVDAISVCVEPVLSKVLQAHMILSFSSRLWL